MSTDKLKFLSLADTSWTTQTRKTKRICALTAGLLILSLLYYYHHHFESQHSQSQVNPFPGLDYSHVNWSRYAYSQYATDEQYLCNSVMLFETLHRLGSNPERVLMYPPSWNTTSENSESDTIGKLLEMARDKYEVKLKPMEMTSSGRDSTWSMSANKLRAFDLTQYDRVLHLDSDVTVLQHLDELFFLPSTPVAMPRAYWQNEKKDQIMLASLIVLLEPSKTEEEVLLDMAAGMGLYDMETLNVQFGSSAMVLPHRNFALLTGEFRSKNHAAYLGNVHESWDPDEVLHKAKLVHFSDWPLPKPWIMGSESQMENLQPPCESTDGESGSCRDREIWRGLYEEFRQRRKQVCEEPFEQPAEGQ